MNAFIHSFIFQSQIMPLYFIRIHFFDHFDCLQYGQYIPFIQAYTYIDKVVNKIIVIQHHA